MDYNLNRGIESLERIKLMMNYSLKNTLSENIFSSNNLIDEQSMGGMVTPQYQSTEISKDIDGPGVFEEKKTTTIPNLTPDSKLKVLEGTQSVQFDGTETTESLFPNLQKDEFGSYMMRNNVRYYFPKDEFWKNGPFVGGTKAFKTPGTAEYPDGQLYHVLMFLPEQYQDYATIGARQPNDPKKDIPSRGWNFYPVYYTTNGNEQTPYNENDIDTRSSFDVLWDEHGLAIQIIGGVLIGLVTAGIGSAVTAGILASEGVVVGTEAAIVGTEVMETIIAGEAAVDATTIGVESATIANEVITAVNAINTGKKVAWGLDVLFQGVMNVSIGFYEMERGQDPTFSFLFAALPVLHTLPGYAKISGKIISYSDETCKEVSKAFSTFGGNKDEFATEVFELLSPQGKKLCESTIKAVKNNPDVFKDLVKEGYEKVITNTVKNKTTIEKMVYYGEKLQVGVAKLALTTAADLSIYYGIEKVEKAYGIKFGKPLPQTTKEQLEYYQKTMNKQQFESYIDRYVNSIMAEKVMSDKSSPVYDILIKQKTEERDRKIPELNIIENNKERQDILDNWENL